MNERIKKVTTVVKEKWTGFSNAIKIMVIAIPVALIAIIIVTAVLLNQKDYTVLYSGLTTAEAGEISAAIAELGVTDVRLNNNEVIVPSDQADSLRMQLAVQGYPKTAKAYDIWNNGVDLWSTAEDKREVARQQREANISATLRQLNAVQYATVNLDIPRTKDYVITEKKEAPTCSITLQLVGDDELTNGEVRAIFDMVSKSVDGLTYDNISVVDTYGRPYEWISKEQEAAEGKDASGVPIARRRFAFQREVESAIRANLDNLLGQVYGRNGYTLSVATLLNYDAKEIQSTEYIPDGDTHAGVMNHDLHIVTSTDLNNAYGLVGVSPNADNSPDYPTLDGLEDGQTYFWNKDETEYSVSNIITKTIKDGYSVENLSVGVVINQTNMTDGERALLERTIAHGAGTTEDKVTVYNTMFDLTQAGGTTIDGNIPPYLTRHYDSYRNMLLFVVIALGIILVLLLIASLCVSRSRKKKIRRRQEQAIAAAQAAAAADVYGGSDRESPQEVDFNIASLTEEAGKESRETILKREIAEFAKTSPDIVASIIKNMLREET